MRTHRQWQYEVRSRHAGDEDDDDDRWGTAGGVHLARGALEGCCASEYNPAPGGPEESHVGAGWRWCGMPIAAMVDLEHEGLEPYPVCFHHAVAITGGRGGASVPIYMVPASGVAVVSLNQLVSQPLPPERRDPDAGKPLLVNERVYVWPPEDEPARASWVGHEGRFVRSTGMGPNPRALVAVDRPPCSAPADVPLRWLRRDRRRA